eukprot:Tbor_TRINITY_DN8268_c0_g1::TRINITY_DN8268_c0_g1_i1::g.15450::m.15450
MDTHGSSQVLGNVPERQINSIYAAPTSNGTHFLTCGNDGTVRYWDTRVCARRKAAVLCIQADKELKTKESDIMEIVGAYHVKGSDSIRDDSRSCWIIAGSEVGAVDLRKGMVRSSYCFTSSVSNGVPDEVVCLSGFDASYRQLPECLNFESTGSSSCRSLAAAHPVDHLFISDDDGAIYCIDKDTCTPVPEGGDHEGYSRVDVPFFISRASGEDSSVGIVSEECIVARPIKDKGASIGGLFGGRHTVCSGFSSFFVRYPDEVRMGCGLVTCGMDSNLHVYGSRYVAGSETSIGWGYPIVPWSNPSATVEIGDVSTISTLQNGNINSSVRDLQSHEMYKLCNPPIPSCFAPYFPITRADGIPPMVAVGRGDGSYVIVDMSTPFPLNCHVGEVADVSPVGPEIAFIAHGHENNTISTLLWSTVPSAGGPIPILTSVATSGEISSWDISKCVLPIVLNEGDGINDEEFEAKLVFAGSARIQSSGGTAAGALANCSTFFGDSSRLLTGMSTGEIVLTNMEYIM